MSKPLSTAERVRRSRWAKQVESTADRLHTLLRETPLPMPREPFIHHDLVAGLIELSGYDTEAHPADNAFDVDFTPSGKNQREWMREIARYCQYDREMSIQRYAELDENGTIPRKRRTMSSQDYAMTLWSDGVNKGWLSIDDTALQARLEADNQVPSSRPQWSTNQSALDIETTLKSMGKACFVKHYSNFANPELTTDEMAALLKREEGYTDTACRTRTSNARRIIKSGNAKKALRLILSSAKISNETRDQAESLLCSMQ